MMSEFGIAKFSLQHGHADELFNSMQHEIQSSFQIHITGAAPSHSRRHHSFGLHLLLSLCVFIEFSIKSSLCILGSFSRHEGGESPPTEMAGAHLVLDLMPFFIGKGFQSGFSLKFLQLEKWRQVSVPETPTAPLRTILGREQQPRIRLIRECQ